MNLHIANINHSPYGYKIIRGLIKDKKDRIWVGGNNSIYKLDVQHAKLVLSLDGISFDSGIANPDGSIFGINLEPLFFVWDGHKVSPIETEFDAFNSECFTMMDYRLKYKNDTSFTYILPFDKRKALIEFTFFTPYVIGHNEYDTYLKKYIAEVLGISRYSISEIEFGNIPMTDFPFHDYHSKNITKIGTAGGWVKGSTGYAFKHTERKVAQIIENIKQDESPSKGLANKKYLFYDKIFLDVLNKENHKGEWIFNKFYTKNSLENMFAFLDERSSLLQDISIMLSLFSKSFIRAFFRTFRNKKA